MSNWWESRQTLQDDSQTTPGENPLPVSEEEPKGKEDSEARAQDAESGHPPESSVRQEEPAPVKTDFRFKSHEEAERGYTELQSTWTKLSQEAAQLRREAEANRHKAEEYERKFSEETRWKEQSQKLREKAVDEYTKATELVNRIDPEDPEYARKVAQIYADRDLSLRNFEREFSVSAPPEKPVPQTAQTAYSADADMDAALKLIKSAEIDPENDPVFIGFANRANPALSMSEQVRYAIDQTKEYKARLVAEARQKANQPLVRQGSGKPQEQPREVQPMSFMDALKSARRTRV